MAWRGGNAGAFGEMVGSNPSPSPIPSPSPSPNPNQVTWSDGSRCGKRRGRRRRARLELGLRVTG